MVLGLGLLLSSKIREKSIAQFSCTSLTVQTNTHVTRIKIHYTWKEINLFNKINICNSCIKNIYNCYWFLPTVFPLGAKARFSKVPIINGLVKLLLSTCKTEVTFNSFTTISLLNKMEYFASQDPRSYSLYFDLNTWFRARKVTGNFEKRAPEPVIFWQINNASPCTDRLTLFRRGIGVFLVAMKMLVPFAIFAKSASLSRFTFPFFCKDCFFC